MTNIRNPYRVGFAPYLQAGLLSMEQPQQAGLLSGAQYAVGQPQGILGIPQHVKYPAGPTTPQPALPRGLLSPEEPEPPEQPVGFLDRFGEFLDSPGVQGLAAMAPMIGGGLSTDPSVPSGLLGQGFQAYNTAMNGARERQERESALEGLLGSANLNDYQRSVVGAMDPSQAINTLGQHAFSTPEAQDSFEIVHNPYGFGGAATMNTRSGQLHNYQGPPSNDAGQRRIIEGADGYQYYADTQERVLPDVQLPQGGPMDVDDRTKLILGQQEEFQAAIQPQVDVINSMEQAEAIYLPLSQGNAVDAAAVQNALGGTANGATVRNENGEVVSQFDASVFNSPNAAGDMALIFSLMKSMDPRSTVREGEFQMAAGLGGMWNQIQGYLNQLSGEGQLTPQVRADIMGQIQRQAGAARSQIDRTTQSYHSRGYAYEGTDIDPTQVYQVPNLYNSQIDLSGGQSQAVTIGDLPPLPGSAAQVGVPLSEFSETDVYQFEYDGRTYELTGSDLQNYAFERNKELEEVLRGVTRLQGSPADPGFTF